MQLMPGTATEYGVRDPHDPLQNMVGGALFLRKLYKKYRSWPLAFAAYNAGPGAVDSHNGIPPYKETQNYVRSIMSMLGGQ